MLVVPFDDCHALVGYWDGMEQRLVGLAHIPSAVDRNRLPRHITIYREHDRYRSHVVNSTEMPHRNQSRTCVWITGHHLSFDQRRCDGVHSYSVFDKSGGTGMRKPNNSRLGRSIVRPNSTTRLCSD